MSATPPLLGSVVDQLGADIVSGDLAEGERFRLGDVEKRFGISRTVAREAMRALEHLGMVSSGRRVGLTVLPMEKWAVYDPAIIGWRLDNDKTRGQLPRQRAGWRHAAARAGPRHSPQYRGASQGHRRATARLYSYGRRLVKQGGILRPSSAVGSLRWPLDRPTQPERVFFIQLLGA